FGAVGLAAHDPQHHIPESVDRLRSGLPISLRHALTLVLRELALELDAFGRELQQALAPVARTRLLHDEALAHQLAEHTAEALLGDPQDAQKLGHGQLRIASDEIYDAVMGAAETIARQHGVGLCGEVPIGVE